MQSLWREGTHHAACESAGKPVAAAGQPVPELAALFALQEGAAAETQHLSAQLRPVSSAVQKSDCEVCLQLDGALSGLVWQGLTPSRPVQQTPLLCSVLFCFAFLCFAQHARIILQRLMRM